MLSPVGFPNFAPCNEGHFFDIVIWSVWQPAASEGTPEHLGGVCVVTMSFFTQTA